MDKSELLAIYDREQRIEVDYPVATREQTDHVIRFVFPGDKMGGYVAYSQLDEATVDAAIDEQVAYFSGLGTGFEWKVYDHDRPVDLRQRLRERGFEVEEPEALMVLDVEEAPAVYWTADTSYVQRITDEAGVRDIVRLEEEVWGDDHSWLVGQLTRDLREMPDRLSVFGVPENGRLASAAWIYYFPPTRFASLWGGSTLPASRRKGYYTALLAARAREARERGFRFLTVDASPMSRPILEKHGFQFLGYSTPCIWKPEKDERRERDG